MRTVEITDAPAPIAADPPVARFSDCVAVPGALSGPPPAELLAPGLYARWTQALPPGDPDVEHLALGRIDLPPARFMRETLSRFWFLGQPADRPRRILFQANSDFEAALARPFVRDCLAAFGIAPGDLARPDRPVGIAHAIVPDPALEETHRHVAFDRTVTRLVAALGFGQPPPPGVGQALHLSSATGLVESFPGEAAFDAALEAAGLTVRRAAEMSAAELVSAIGQADLLSSIAPRSGNPGSIEIVALAREPGAHLVLCPGAIDLASRRALAGGRARPPVFLVAPDRPDPQALASTCLRALRRLARIGRLPDALAFATGQTASDIDHAVLAHASCSSARTGLASDVVGRGLSGTARLVTEPGQRPWFEADLGAIRAVGRIGVHAPADADGPAQRLRVLGSVDGRGWEILGEGATAPPDDDRFAPALEIGWPEPRALRRIRIQLTETGTLALDQVEILGPRHRTPTRDGP